MDTLIKWLYKMFMKYDKRIFNYVFDYKIITVHSKTLKWSTIYTKYRVL